MTAAERMAAANKAQAAEQARQQRRGEITVRKYQPVDLPGSVDDFVKARGVRAPLLLLYGLAASAAQAIEPILPVSHLCGAAGASVILIAELDMRRVHMHLCNTAVSELLNDACADVTLQSCKNIRHPHTDSARMLQQALWPACVDSAFQCTSECCWLWWYVKLMVS